jgi:hypothetical protein
MSEVAVAAQAAAAPPAPAAPPVAPDAAGEGEETNTEDMVRRPWSQEEDDLIVKVRSRDPGLRPVTADTVVIFLCCRSTVGRSIWDSQVVCDCKPSKGAFRQAVQVGFCWRVFSYMRGTR